MHPSTFLLTILSATTLVTSAPTTTTRRDTDTYYGVSLYVNVHPQGETPLNEPAPMEINVLNSNFNGIQASELSFDKGVHPNVDVDKVECRMYKDAAGTVPGSAPFTAEKKALLSATGVVSVGSVLCYIVE